MQSQINFAVGRVNCFKPLGHSGQPRLHEVVGSILIEQVCQNAGTFNNLVAKKLNLKRNKFHILLRVICPSMYESLTCDIKRKYKLSALHQHQND